MCNERAKDVQGVCLRCASDVQRMCKKEVQGVCLRCASDVQWMCKEFAIGESRMLGPLMRSPNNVQIL